MGDACITELDCCDAACLDATCAKPPPACLADAEPALMVTGLDEPYALGASAAALFLGQLAYGRPLLRIPKDGSNPEVLVEAADSVDYLIVRQGTVIFSEESAVSTVPITGGPKGLLASASRPAGLDVTERYVYFAEQLADRLVRIDRQTLKIDVLGSASLKGIYRVAAAEDAGAIYFSSAHPGLRRYVLDGWFDSLLTLHPPARAVRLFGEYIYFVLPASGEVYRVPAINNDVELLADLSPHGVHAESLDSDGQFLYLTLETGVGNGLIIRLPMSGGEIEIIADAQGPQPSALTVDEMCVYWTELETGSVFRARKQPGF